MSDYVIKLRRDTAANWASVNPILGDGEIGFEKCTKKHKIGNGTLAWNDLDYAGIKGDDGSPGIPGNDGAPGIQGEQGVRGQSGNDGVPGAPGEQGIQGPPGQAGEQGPQGLQGLKGDTGDTGAQGSQGYPGETGSQGIQGIPGNDGAQGIQGIQGSPGNDGTPGAKGDTGDAGSQGIQGIQGSPGADSTVPGPQGDQGIQGIQGIQGVQGDVGPQGSPGVSNYSISVHAASQSTTTDSQTLYWGSMLVAPSATANRWRVYIPKAGTIKSARIYSYAGTAGSNENWSMYIRKNNTSDTLIQTLAANTNDRIWANDALSISVVAGDYIEIKEIQPAWGTNPATVTRAGVIYLE